MIWKDCFCQVNRRHKVTKIFFLYFFPNYEMTSKKLLSIQICYLKVLQRPLFLPPNTSSLETVVPPVNTVCIVSILSLGTYLPDTCITHGYMMISVHGILSSAVLESGTRMSIWLCRRLNLLFGAFKSNKYCQICIHFDKEIWEKILWNYNEIYKYMFIVESSLLHTKK